MEESNTPSIDPDFEPQSRPRSCTWPLPRPDISVVKVEGTEESATTPPEEDKPDTQQITAEYEKSAAGAEGGLAPSLGGGATPRKGSSRRNAWGNQSYADLISQAIENSPEKRLTLAQIYEWMVKTVPYFRDKGDSNSSAGWKNSIRHNLSLHNKFLRVHNESTGKSSWWMLNPEGGKTGKAPRRRATSMDNSSKLLKSRMRAKQTKKQAVAAGLSSPGGSIQTEGNGASGGSDSPNSSQQFSKWGVNSNSPSSRGSLDDSDMWTTFRPRTSSNASTLSGRLSPIAPGHEDDDNLPDDSLLGRYATPTLTETLMEELDLIDGLTLMTGQGGASPSTAPPAPPTPLPSASTLLPRGSSFSSFHQRQSSSIPQATSHSNTSVAASQCGPSSKEPLFSNSLFNPLPNPLPNSMSNSMSNPLPSTMSSSMSSSTRGNNHYSGHVPSSLEALLTSDSPPPNEVLLSQVDPVLQSPGSVGLMGLGSSLGVGVRTKPSLGSLLIGKGLEPNTVAPMALQMQSQTHHLHQQQQHHHHHPGLGLGMSMLSNLSSETSHLSGTKAQHSAVSAMHHQGTVASANTGLGLQGMAQFAAPSCFQTAPDRLPTDLDIDMFTENLDCDVDYIINTDLMDGIDFNFDPILPDTQGYTGQATTQGSSHNWVPS